VTTAEPTRGPVDVANLGPTPILEHVFLLSAESVANWWDNEALVADASRYAHEELAHRYALRCPDLLLPAFHEAGVTGIDQMLADDPHGCFSAGGS